MSLPKDLEATGVTVGPSPDDLNIAEDRLDGAEAIAAFRGEPVHRTRYLLRRDMIAGVWREGERYVGSKRAIREAYLAAAHVQTGKTAA